MVSGHSFFRVFFGPGGYSSYPNAEKQMQMQNTLTTHFNSFKFIQVHSIIIKMLWLVRGAGNRQMLTLADKEEGGEGKASLYL